MKCNMNHRDSYKWPECGPDRDDYNKYYPKPHPKHEIETILRCGTSMGSIPVCTGNEALTGRVIDGIISSNRTVVASVALDTRELINPTIKIDFSSLISFKTIGEDNYSLRLVFKLSKICGGHPVPLGTWTFEQTHQEGAALAPVEGEFVQESDPFCFSWCECDDCPDCCRYIVEVEDQCYNIEFATISNISLSALAVGLKKSY